MIPKLSSAETRILEILARLGRLVVTRDIVIEYQKLFPGTPKQVVYRALASMRKKEVVTINKGKTSVNTIWISRWQDTLSRLDLSIEQTEITDKMVFTFPSIWAAAPTIAHWANVATIQSDKSLPVLYINPHQWFYVARPWSEEMLIENLVNSGHTLWQGIGGRSVVDRYVLDTYFNKHPQVRGSFIDPRPGDESLYIGVMGEVIVTLSVTAVFTKRLDQWYQENSSITPNSIEEMQSIVKESGVAKVVIYRNAKKADQYRRHMKKFIVS